MSSEVARLTERLQLEAEAAFLGLYGYAETTKHEIIQHSLQCIGETCEQLKQHIGEEEAAMFVINALDKAQQREHKNGTHI